MQILTIGHSNHSLEYFLGLLSKHGVTAIGDVRSMPYSRQNPQYNRETLSAALQEKGIAYIFLGEVLGGRSADRDCYEKGRMEYRKLAQKQSFQAGLRHALEAAQQYRLCLLCAEKEPLECHRTILVSRRLAERGADVQHLLADGGIESHISTLERLLRELQLPQEDLFRTHEEMIEDAYLAQERRIAFTRETPAHSGDANAVTL